MGEDWREFRARLVARERSSSGATLSTGGDGENNMNISDPKKKQPRKQSWQQSSTAKEETTGGIFSAILSSMFSKGGSGGSNGSESSSSSSENNNKERARTLAEQVDAATTTRARQTKETTTNVPSTRGGGDIFDGYSVGGATKFSTIGVSSSSTSSSSSSSCSDPFMDEEECALIYNVPNNVKLDKHRWAHPLFHVEPGCILVANERLGGVFHQTVVLIIDHNEAAGSTGMVINR